MELIESTSPETPDRIENDEDVRKAMEKTSLEGKSDQDGVSTVRETGNIFQNAEKERPTRLDKAELEESNNQTLKAETDSAETHKVTPDEELTPEKPEKRSERTAASSFKLPVTPRRNVIPSRRAGFENGNRPLPGAPKNTPLPETSHDVKQLSPAMQASDEQRAEMNNGLERNEAAADAADLPTRTDLAAITPDTSAPDRATGSPTGKLDTPRAEETWLENAPTSRLEEQETNILAAVEPAKVEVDPRGRQQANETDKQAASFATMKLPAPATPAPGESARFADTPTTPLPASMPANPAGNQGSRFTRRKAFILMILLAIVLINASVSGFNQFFGAQGWGSVAFGSSDDSGSNLLQQISQQMKSPTPGGSSKATPAPPTPEQIVNQLLANMTLDEKLGQMMMIQFAGQSYSPEIDAMINHYKIGSVLYFQFNIGSKSQLTGLNAQMQKHAFLPLLTAVDQEGGYVDRLINLDGPQQSATMIGATGDTNKAYEQGVKDAKNLAAYGFNLNLAPVVDVHNVDNSQMYGRTFGDNPQIVTKMASAYLKGLQDGGKVLGTLKHFPGLGDTSTDPHTGLPEITRSLSNLNSIDWAPYSNLIKQGNVYSIMVTHEIVDALDKTQPSSLSPKVLGILRNQMHFQGVIITDSLTMDAIHNSYTYGEAAAKAVEAGNDILMGADSPNTLAQMIKGIKQAMSSGAISQQRIDNSVRRILLMKYQLGLLHL